MCNMYKGVCATKRYACYNHLDREIGPLLLYLNPLRAGNGLNKKRRNEA